WAPGVHTLALAGRLANEQDFRDQGFRSFVLSTNTPGTYRFEGYQTFSNMTFRSEFETYTAELNQIFQTENHTLVLGGRFQDGQFSSQDKLDGVPPARANLFFK